MWFRTLVTITTLTIFSTLATADSISSSELKELRQQISALTKSVATLQKTIEAQQSQINSLTASPISLNENGATAVPTPMSANHLSAPKQVAAQAAAPSRVTGQFNPDIGLVGDIVGTLSQSREDEEGNDRISVREVELVLGHDIDPYSRFDSTIAFSDSEDASLEEAYVTYWDLPAGTKGRFGRFRPKIGLASPLHRDSLETVDEPLVVQRYLGVEGFSKAGVEFSNFIPMPWELVSHEVIFGVLEGGNGEEGMMFGDTNRRPTYYGRLRHSADISDDTLLNLGTTVLAGSADADSANEVRSLGADLLLSHNFSSVRKLKFVAEGYLQDRSAPFLAEDNESPGESEFKTNPFGLYTLLDFRADERWSVGGRWDYVESANLDRELESHEAAYTAYLTYHQSEFARWRLQYQRIQLLDGLDDDRVLLQGTFAIGTHKHQLQ